MSCFQILALAPLRLLKLQLNQFIQHFQTQTKIWSIRRPFAKRRCAKNKFDSKQIVSDRDPVHDLGSNLGFWFGQSKCFQKFDEAIKPVSPRIIGLGLYHRKVHIL